MPRAGAQRCETFPLKAGNGDQPLAAGVGAAVLGGSGEDHGISGSTKTRRGHLAKAGDGRLGGQGVS